MRSKILRFIIKSCFVRERERGRARDKREIGRENNISVYISLFIYMCVCVCVCVYVCMYVYVCASSLMHITHGTNGYIRMHILYMHIGVYSQFIR